MSIYEFWSDPIGDAAELDRREQAQAAGDNALMTEAAQKIDELERKRDGYQHTNH